MNPRLVHVVGAPGVDKDHVVGWLVAGIRLENGSCARVRAEDAASRTNAHLRIVFDGFDLVCVDAECLSQRHLESDLADGDLVIRFDRLTEIPS